MKRCTNSSWQEGRNWSLHAQPSMHIAVHPAFTFVSVLPLETRRFYDARFNCVDTRVCCVVHAALAEQTYSALFSVGSSIYFFPWPGVNKPDLLTRAYEKSYSHCFFFLLLPPGVLMAILTFCAAYAPISVPTISRPLWDASVRGLLRKTVAIYPSTQHLDAEYSPKNKQN